MLYTGDSDVEGEGTEFLPEDLDIDADDLDRVEKAVRDTERRMGNLVNDLAFGIEAELKASDRAAKFAAAEEVVNSPIDEQDPEEEEVDRESYTTRDGDWAHPDSQHKADQTKSVEQQYYNESGADKYADELRLYKFLDPRPFLDCDDEEIRDAVENDKVTALFRVEDPANNGKPTLMYGQVQTKKVLLDVTYDEYTGKLVKTYTSLWVVCYKDDSESTDIVQFVECP
jgi:hypothetical protein